MKVFRIDTAVDDLARDGMIAVHSRGRTGIHCTFPNGWLVSIQWGPGTYSGNHQDLSFRAFTAPVRDSVTAEVAAWKDGGDLITWPDGDQVQGWQSWEQVQQILDDAAADRLEAADAVPSEASA